MRILTDDQVASLLPMDQAIAVIDTTMRTVSAGGTEMPLRHVVPLGGGNGMGVMTGAVSQPDCFGVKLLSLFPGNPARGLSSHRGAIVLFEPETGGAVAMMDAGRLTAIRTAAASAVATRALARPDCETLALIGAGEQAEHHLAAMLAVRPIRRVLVAARSEQSAAAFAERMAEAHPGLAVEPAPARDAVAEADIVCTVTSSPEPVLHGDWLRPGQHLNIVGASVPSKREVDDAVVLKASVWVDYLPSALAQAGELVEMIAAGTIDGGHIRGEIGAVLDGAAPGRARAEEITLYRSLGNIAQDLAAAHHVLGRAEAAGAGAEVAF